MNNHTSPPEAYLLFNPQGELYLGFTWTLKESAEIALANANRDAPGWTMVTYGPAGESYELATLKKDYNELINVLARMRKAALERHPDWLGEMVTCPYVCALRLEEFQAELLNRPSDPQPEKTKCRELNLKPEDVE